MLIRNKFGVKSTSLCIYSTQFIGLNSMLGYHRITMAIYEHDSLPWLCGVCGLLSSGNADVLYALLTQCSYLLVVCMIRAYPYW